MSIKKTWVIIILLIFATLGGIAAYVIVDRNKTNEEKAKIEEEKSLQLFDFSSNDIKKVNIQNSDGHFLVDYDTANGWEISDTDYPYSLTLNDYYINVIASYMSDLTAKKKLDIPSDQLESYGLITPTVVTCYQGDTAYTLYVGNPSATNEFYYAMKDNDTTVYEIDFNEGEVLRGGLSYLRDPYMISYSDVDISYAKLVRKNQTAFEIQKDENSTWQMEQPLQHTALNFANINSFLTTVTRLETEKFLKVVEENKDLKEYKLDNPAYQFAVKTKDGNTMTIDFAPFQNDDTEVYLVYEETGEICTMSVKNVSFLDTQTSELMSDKILSPEFTKISELEVQADDLHFTLTMNHDEKAYTFQPDITADAEPISMNTDDLVSVFKDLYLTASNLTYDSLDLKAEPDTDKAPTILFHYIYLDGTEQEVSLVPIDDTYYWAFVDGNYTGKKVRRRALTGTTGIFTYYEKLNDTIALNS